DRASIFYHLVAGHGGHRDEASRDGERLGRPEFAGMNNRLPCDFERRNDDHTGTSNHSSSVLPGWNTGLSSTVRNLSSPNWGSQLWLCRPLSHSNGVYRNGSGSPPRTTRGRR